MNMDRLKVIVIHKMKLGIYLIRNELYLFCQVIYFFIYFPILILFYIFIFILVWNENTNRCQILI